MCNIYLNRKGFTLFELLASLIVLGVILGVGFYLARGTLATTVDAMNGVGEREVYDAAELYVLENNVSWINDGDEYTCLMVDQLVDMGYFDSGEVSDYQDRKIKVVRNSVSKVISDVKFVDVCE